MCEVDDHGLEIFEVGIEYDLLRCKKCGPLATGWDA